MNIGQYLDKDDLLGNIEEQKINPDDVISTDTYNESALLKTFLNRSEDSQIKLYKCAINTDIVGTGGKNYGFVKHVVNGKETILEIKKIYDEEGIKYGKGLNEKYDDNVLSVRRLSRLLRFHVQRFISQNNRPSYLWRKYNNSDKNMVGICFPGGEHIVKTKEEMDYLYNAYKKLDDMQKTKFVDRLNRVFQARGLIKSDQLYK